MSEKITPKEWREFHEKKAAEAGFHWAINPKTGWWEPRTKKAPDDAA